MTHHQQLELGDPSNKARLVVSDAEAKEVNFIFQTYLSEGSLYRTAAKLRELGIRPKVSAKKSSADLSAVWNTQTLQCLLRNQTYVGVREINKRSRGENPDDLKPYERHQMVKAAWPAIVDEETFSTVQRMLDENAKLERSRREGGERRVFLFSGLMSCSQCGRSLVGATGHGQSRPIRYYLHRPIEGKPVTCSVKSFRADEIEEAILEHLQGVVEKEGYFKDLERKFAVHRGTTVSILEVRKQKLERKISKAEKDLRGLVQIQIDAVSDSSLRQVYGEQLKRIMAEKDADTALLSDVTSQLSQSGDAKIQRETVQVHLKQLRAAWDKSPPSLQKRLLRALFQRLVVYPDAIDIFYHTDSSESRVGQPVEDTKPELKGGLSQEGSVPHLVNLRTLEIKKPLDGSAHKAKVQGSYIDNIGSGGRI